MKKLLLILLSFPIIGFGQNVYIPDANFKAYLIGNTSINTNGDSEIQVNEAVAFNGTILCPNMNIADLTGIEAFTSLTYLHCNLNQLTSLDVSQNTALTKLFVEFNQLTILDVSNNTALTQLGCSVNNLTSLDVSNNNVLTHLFCFGNQFTSLDVRNGNNTNMNDFISTNNLSLTCINVDDSTWSANNWTVANQNIDPQHYFSINCPLGFGCTDSLALNYDSLATIDDSSCIYCALSASTTVVDETAAGSSDGSVDLTVSGTSCVTTTDLFVSVAGSNAQSGNAFNLINTSGGDLYIDGFSQGPGTGNSTIVVDMEVFCAYADYTSGLPTWTSVATASSVQLTANATTGYIQIPGGITIPVGGTYGFWVGISSGPTQQYTTSTGTPGSTPWASDANVTITEGHGGVYPTGVSYSPRGWNGTIHYGDPNVNAYSCLWSTGDTTEDLSNVTSGTYTVSIIDCQGCTATTSATITVMVPGCTDPLACNYDSLASTDDSSCVYPVIWQQTFLICDGDSVVVGGSAYDTTGAYTDTLNALNGCDSIVYTDISIAPPIIWQQAFTICDGDSIIVGSSVYDTTGYYTDTLSVANGCDTIMYTNILVDLNTSSYDTVITCDNYDWNGVTYTSSGIYTSLTAAASGTYTQTININSSTLTSVNTFNFPSTPTGAIGGVLTLEVVGDIDGTGSNLEEWTIQDESSTAIGAVGATGNFADQCNTTITNVISLTASQINTWSVDGSISFTAIDLAGNIDVTTLCGANQFLALTLTYQYGTCVHTDTLALTITTNSVNLFATSLNVSCNGFADGSILATASGGTFPMQYSLDGGVSQTSGTFSNLSAGSYYIDVTDANGCSSNQTVTIIQPTLIVSTVTSLSNTTCFGYCDGEINLGVTGGVPPYLYSIDGGATFQANPSFSNLCAGSYYIHVTDANGCLSNQSSVIINQPSALITGVTTTNVSCFGMCNGSAFVIPSGGFSPYTYLWSNGTVTDASTNLCAGIYTCTVTDANNCITLSTVIVTEPPLLSVSVDSTDETSALNDGSATATILGGTLPYSYYWSNGGTTSAINNLPSGSYYVNVTDSNGCIISGSTFVNAYFTTGIINGKNTNTLINIFDMLGQETPCRRNATLFYIYNDGTVEKRIVIE